MNTLKNDINKLLGISEPTFSKCIIAITFDGKAVLIKSDPNLEEVFDGSDLEDNLTDNRLLPKEAGVYNCIIKYHSFKCNLPCDPVEYDYVLTIESCELIDINSDDKNIIH